MSCVRLTLLLSCVLVSVCCNDSFINPRPTLAQRHRHRHERSHKEEYDLDRLLNRLDNHLPATTATMTPTTQTPPRHEVPVTESNSLWEEETVGSSPTAWGLDSGRWSMILRKDEGKRLEDETVEEGEEEDEDEDDSKGLTEQADLKGLALQADSSRSWVSRDSHITEPRWNQCVV